MASFFSELGKSFQDAAKSLQEMTSEGVEARKRNSELRALREEKRKLFCALGEAYYASRENHEAVEQLELMVRRIDEITEQMRAVTAQLDALSDKRRCPKCENVVDKSAKFCPVCGEKLPEPAPKKEPKQEPKPEPEPEQAQPPKAEYCAECGALRAQDARFCPVCGKPFAAQKPEVEINWPDAVGEAAATREEPSAEETGEQ